MILKKLKECLKNEINDKNIFDIVVYGSTVKGKVNPNDLDIAVIFKEGDLKDRLERIQQMKKKVKIEKIDIKGILWQELFQEGFFGRTGIFLEGISLSSGKAFSNKIGFEGFTIFIHDLKNKSHTEKVKFNYVLNGRNNEGIIKKLQGKHLMPGVNKIPIEYSVEYEDVLKKNNIQYYKLNTLIER